MYGPRKLVLSYIVLATNLPMAMAFASQHCYCDIILSQTLKVCNSDTFPKCHTGSVLGLHTWIIMNYNNQIASLVACHLSRLFFQPSGINPLSTLGSLFVLQWWRSPVWWDGAGLYDRSRRGQVPQWEAVWRVGCVQLPRVQPVWIDRYRQPQEQHIRVPGL